MDATCSWCGYYAECVLITMSLSNFILDLEPLVNSNRNIQDDARPPGESLSTGDHVVVGLDDTGTPLMAKSVPHPDNESSAEKVAETVDSMKCNGIIEMVVEGDYKIAHSDRHQLVALTKQ